MSAKRALGTVTLEDHGDGCTPLNVSIGIAEESCELCLWVACAPVAEYGHCCIAHAYVRCLECLKQNGEAFRDIDEADSLDDCLRYHGFGIGVGAYERGNGLGAP